MQSHAKAAKLVERLLTNSRSTIMQQRSESATKKQANDWPYQCSIMNWMKHDCMRVPRAQSAIDQKLALGTSKQQEYGRRAHSPFYDVTLVSDSVEIVIMSVSLLPLVKVNGLQQIWNEIQNAHSTKPIIQSKHQQQTASKPTEQWIYQSESTKKKSSDLRSELKFQKYIEVVGTTCFTKLTQPPCYAQWREEVRLQQHDLARHDHLELLFFFRVITQS